MIPVRIISVSKPPRGPYQELTEMFTKHLKSSAQVEFVDVKASRFSSEADRPKVQKEEAERIRTVIPKDAVVVALDEHGEEFSSRGFADLVKELEDKGQKLCIIIGGPLGLDSDLKQEADQLVSLSKMTLPHDLAKIVFLEQLYRAFTIIRGKHYHY